MRRLSLILCLAIGLAVVPAEAHTVIDPLNSDRNTYAFGEAIEIVLDYCPDDSVRMGKYWRITNIHTGEEVSFYQWAEGDRTLTCRNGRRTWVWHQLGPSCYGECQNVSPGRQVPAGRYEISIQMSGERVTHRFTIGQYFTLGFEARPTLEFNVFVGSQPEIDQMTAEAEAEDKTLIVSGVVRKARDYNADWKISMGSHSIVLGEAFIEVCDGSPHYVQRHRTEWLGERWCPWDSYVKRVGR
jgi:hypothetical protein